MVMLMQIQQIIQENGKAQALAAQEQAQASKEQCKRMEVLEAKLKSMEAKRSRSPGRRDDRREPNKTRRHN